MKERWFEIPICAVDRNWYWDLCHEFGARHLTVCAMKDKEYNIIRIYHKSRLTLMVIKGLCSMHRNVLHEYASIEYEES